MLSTGRQDYAEPAREIWMRASLQAGFVSPEPASRGEPSDVTGERSAADGSLPPAAAFAACVQVLVLNACVRGRYRSSSCGPWPGTTNSEHCDGLLPATRGHGLVVYLHTTSPRCSFCWAPSCRQLELRASGLFLDHAIAQSSQIRSP